MSIIRRATSNAREMRYGAFGQGDPYAIPTNGSLAGFSSAGISVDADSAMGLAAVWTCVRILSTTVASFPIDSYKKTGRNVSMTETNFPILENPFGDETGYPLSRQAGFEQMMISLLLRGNAFSYVTARDERGFPTRLLPLSPDVVKVDRDRKTGESTYMINGQYVDRADLIHTVGMSMPGMNFGMTPVAYLRQTLGLGLAADEYGSRF